MGLAAERSRRLARNSRTSASKEEDEADDQFWNQDFFADNVDGDSEYSFTDEEDEFDSDFSITEENDADDEDAGERELLQQEKLEKRNDRAKQQRLSGIADKALRSLNQARRVAKQSGKRERKKAAASPSAVPNEKRTRSPRPEVAYSSDSTTAGARRSARSTTAAATVDTALRVQQSRKKEEERRKRRKLLKEQKEEVPELTQEDRIEIAEQTAVENGESLRKLLEIEETQKKKSTRKRARVLTGNRALYVSRVLRDDSRNESDVPPEASEAQPEGGVVVENNTKCDTNSVTDERKVEHYMAFTKLPDVLEQSHPQRVRRKCVVSARVGRYRDPITRFLYHSLEEFRVIRSWYDALPSARKTAISNNSPRALQWLKAHLAETAAAEAAQNVHETMTSTDAAVKTEPLPPASAADGAGDNAAPAVASEASEQSASPPVPALTMELMEVVPRNAGESIPAEVDKPDDAQATSETTTPCCRESTENAELHADAGRTPGTDAPTTAVDTVSTEVHAAPDTAEEPQSAPVAETAVPPVEAASDSAVAASQS